MESSQALCVVRLSPSQDCFVTLPRQHSSRIPRRLGDVGVVRICLASDPRVTLLSSVRASVTSGEEGDVVIMGSGLGFRDGEHVIISTPGEGSLAIGVKVIGNVNKLKPNIKSQPLRQYPCPMSMITQVFITPASEADWQILQLNQRRLENVILSQVRIIMIVVTFVMS